MIMKKNFWASKKIQLMAELFYIECMHNCTIIITCNDFIISP